MKKIKIILRREQKRPDKEVKAKPFRISGKHLFLTYPKTDIPREEGLRQLQERLKPRIIEKYVIGTEEHLEGEKHIHAYIGLDKRCDIESKERLDLEKEGKRYHGNYQSCRSFRAVCKYIIKGGIENVLTNMDLMEDGRERNPWSEILSKVKEREIRETLEDIKDLAPKMVLTDYTRLKRSLQDLKRDVMGKMDVSRVIPVEKFVKDEMLEKYFTEERHRKTLYLSGKTGIGKTEYIKARLVELLGAEYVVRITDIEGLKVLDGSEKAIILDDIDISELKAEVLIGLLDVCNNSDIRILYGAAHLKAGVSRVVISNKTLPETFRLRNFPPAQWEAILRRVMQIDLRGKVLKITMELREEK